MSEFREYKDRRAFAEGWPHCHVNHGEEHVHEATPNPVDLPEPIEKFPIVTGNELEYYRHRK